MRISKITLHGFKSYLEPAEFNCFDPQFNAITGLNGSGKSNILDAICFALGQNAPTKFRVKSLAELVYKKGTGGINYASVILQFDLQNSSKRPLLNGVEVPGDTLTIERKFILHGNVSKITINGQNSTLNALQNMFKSVQLNILNPHFLIMQGRVTKVLSMRPPEIWSMVEEAAGTSVYRERRVTTIRNLKTNEEQIRQVEESIKSNVDPKLKKVELDEANKKALIGKENELRRLERVYHAISYYNLQQQLEGHRQEKTEKENEADEHIAALEQLRTRVEELNAEVEALQAKLPAAAKSGAKLEEQLTQLARQAKKELTEIRSRLANKQRDLTEDETQLNETRQKTADGGDHIAAAQQKLGALKKQCDELHAKRAKIEQDCSRAEADYVALQTGVAGEDGAQSIEQQLETIRQEESELKNEISLLEKKMQSDSKQVEKLEKEEAVLRRQQPNDAETARFTALNDELRRLRTQVEQLPADSVLNEQQRELHAQIDKLARESDHAVHEARQLEKQTQYFQFSYTDEHRRAVTITEPTPKIAGTIAQLVRARTLREVEGGDEAENEADDAFFCTALETAIGGALHNVVVDKATTARDLLDKCKLTRRTVFEPLDTVQSRGVLNSQQLAHAKRLVGANNVWRACDLVDCAAQYRPCIEKVLGRVWICRRLDQANKIAYEQGIESRAVTLDGETVSPGGEFTGGGRADGKKNLATFQKLFKIRQRISALQAQSESVQNELTNFDEELKKFAAEKQKVVDAEQQLTEYRLRDAAGNKLVQLTAQLQSIKQSHDQAQLTLAEKRDRLEIVRVEAENLQQQVNTGGVERQLKAAETLWKELNSAKSKIDKQFQTREAAVQAQQAVFDELTADIGVNSGTIAELEAKIATFREEVEVLRAESEQKKQASSDADEKSAQYQQKKRQDAANFNKVKENQAKTAAKMNDKNKKLTDIQARIGAIEAACAAMQQELRTMRENYTWIPMHAANFGQPGTEFSFQNTTREQLHARIDAVQKEIKDLELKTDRNDVCDATEAKNKMSELRQKKSRLELDRSKLLELITALDTEKELIMSKTIQKTNGFFGKIFASLLPNSDARLVRCEEEEHSTKRAKNPQNSTVDGLEIQVEIGRGGRLNSLKELSGGQRSLVALSLILAMLKINPAPIYVLDEIDAALDLSHTCRVGQMISDFFKESQFIIVSLKQGMFTNANVLYEIFFREGTSRFRRTEGGNKLANNRLGNANDDGEEVEEANARKAPGRQTKKTKLAPAAAATATTKGKKAVAPPPVSADAAAASRKVARKPQLAAIGSDDDDAYVTADEADR